MDMAYAVGKALPGRPVGGQRVSSAPKREVPSASANASVSANARCEQHAASSKRPWSGIASCGVACGPESPSVCGWGACARACLPLGGVFTCGIPHHARGMRRFEPTGCGQLLRRTSPLPDHR